MDSQDSRMSGLADALPGYDTSAKHVFPQPKISDTKVHEGILLQTSAGGLDKKLPSSFSLAVRQKSEVDLPGYTGRVKAVKDAQTLAIRPRKKVISHAKVPTSIVRRAVKALTTKLCQIRSRLLPLGLLLTKCEPTAGHPYLFSGRIKLNESLKDYLDSDDHDDEASFLDQSIATGDWYGAHLTVSALRRQPIQTHYFYDMVTWRDFLTILYDFHPTGTSFDFRGRPWEVDSFPEEYWEYFYVHVILFRGAKVE